MRELTRYHGESRAELGYPLQGAGPAGIGQLRARTSIGGVQTDLGVHILVLGDQVLQLLGVAMGVSVCKVCIFLLITGQRDWLHVTAQFPHSQNISVFNMQGLIQGQVNVHGPSALPLEGRHSSCIGARLLCC